MLPNTSSAANSTRRKGSESHENMLWDVCEEPSGEDCGPQAIVRRAISLLASGRTKHYLTMDKNQWVRAHQALCLCPADRAGGGVQVLAAGKAAVHFK
jgi:hypothetical protein